MYIDRILSPIEVLGPGKRLVIWTKGCTRQCRGCANPELWDTDGANDYPVTDIVRIIKNIYANESFDGITISGGEPLLQIDDLLELLSEIKNLTSDILIYTGYRYDDLENAFGEDRAEKLKAFATVIIDGPYIEEKNTPDVVLRGSTNQNIIFLKEDHRQKYEEYLTAGRRIQNVYMGSKLVSVGIHNRKEEIE